MVVVDVGDCSIGGVVLIWEALREALAVGCQFQVRLRVAVLAVVWFVDVLSWIRRGWRVIAPNVAIDVPFGGHFMYLETWVRVWEVGTRGRKSEGEGNLWHSKTSKR